MTLHRFIANPTLAPQRQQLPGPGMNTKTPKCAVSAVEAVANNNDLLTLILLRLPPKPLHKFKCVSKEWRSLISDQQFHLSYLHRRPNPSALLLSKYLTRSPHFHLVPLRLSSSAELADVPPLDYLNVEPVRFLQSCHGLILCVAKFLGSLAVVCNPSTRQFRKIPYPVYKLSLIVDNDVKFGFLGLAYDPLKSPYYKVVFLHYSKRFGGFLPDVYSSETDSWKNVEFEQSPLISGEPRMLGVVYCNGTIYWGNGLYFDVEDEKLKELPPLPSGRGFHFLGECGGHLYSVDSEDSSREKELQILEMASDYSGWSVRHRMDLNCLNARLSELTLNGKGFEVLSVVLAEKDEESVVLLLVDGIVISYNLSDKTCSKLCDLRELSSFPTNGCSFDWKNAFLYFESLANV